MEGYIKISTTDTGISSETRLAHVSGLDKIMLLNAFAHSLGMDDKELQQALLILPVARGMFSGKEVSADE